ncbi:MAG: hypothetical protein ONB12_10470 [candidate division KSB1 bacterium]|nr:hypothetical protein [candidate division KSB1 bacterium]
MADNSLPFLGAASFDPSREILALDMDGVIIDSIRECLFNAYNAYADYCGDRHVPDEAALSADWLKEARRLRNFIRQGEDYVYIAHAIHQNAAIENQQAFDAFTEQWRDLRQRFFDLIYHRRLEFSRETPHLWGELNPLYPGIHEFLTTYPHKENLYIITSKRLTFVEKILQAHRIVLPQENIFDTSAASKGEIIKRLLHERACDARAFHFVDDQVDTLLKIKPLGINLYLAGWGYNNQDQKKKAQNNNIPVLDLSEFYRRFGEPSSR